MKIEDLKAVSKNDAFIKFMGIEIITILPNKASTKLKITENLLNFFGAGHGGAIFALADVAFSLCCNASDTIKIAVALNSNINFAKKVNKNDILIAEAQVVSESRSTSITQITIRNQNNELVATFEGVAHLKRNEA